MDSHAYQTSQSHFEAADSSDRLDPRQLPAALLQRQSRPRPIQQSHSQDGKGDYFSNSSLASVNIYALVDSWRSYRNDSNTLQHLSGSATVLNATAASFVPTHSEPTQTRTNSKPYEALRSVYNYTRYPSYRVDKSYRKSSGTAEKCIVEATNGLNIQSTPDTKSISATPPGESRRKNKKAKKAKQLKSIPEHLGHANDLHHDSPSIPHSAQFASRYPVRSNRGQAPKLIPSIEVDDAVNQPGFQNAVQASENPHRSAQCITPRSTKSPQAPESSYEYRQNAHEQPSASAGPRKLLVILDLNGTLLYRTKVGNKKVHMRPGVTPFLDYLFSNHVVMVYTSTMPQTAQAMVKQFLHPSQRQKLAAIWARDQLDLTKDQFYRKVQVYKKLDKIWADSHIQGTAGPGNVWDHSNTVLIDDSREKALAQPYNLLQVPEYLPEDDPAKVKGRDAYMHAYTIQQDIVRQLETKLELLRFQQDVSRLIRTWQECESSVHRSNEQELIEKEGVDEEKVDKEEYCNGSTPYISTHLPTPDSSDDQDYGGVDLCEDFSRMETRRERSRSVSPIGESVFRALLEGNGK